MMAFSKNTLLQTAKILEKDAAKLLAEAASYLAGAEVDADDKENAKEKTEAAQRLQAKADGFYARAARGDGQG
jgi:hypothetical protein